jgi:hypothetical protein
MKIILMREFYLCEDKWLRDAIPNCGLLEIRKVRKSDAARNINTYIIYSDYSAVVVETGEHPIVTYVYTRENYRNKGHLKVLLSYITNAHFAISRKNKNLINKLIKHKYSIYLTTDKIVFLKP